MSFKSDIKLGEAVEQEILEIIQKQFPHAIRNTDKSTRELFDIVIPESGEQKEILIEVKGDFYKSENLAFECLGKGGRNTGIIKTSALYWFHFRKDQYLIWNLVRLKKYLLNLGGHMKYGGDNNTGMWIVPEIKIMKECTPDVMIPKGSDMINEFLTKNL